MSYSSHHQLMSKSMSTWKGSKPRFFNVIINPEIQLHKLKIPKKFVENHGEQLPKEGGKVWLQVPKGNKWWPVELVGSSSSLALWLCAGWPEFTSHYSIRLGQFLVFRYLGNSRFRVAVFGFTAVEIDYPAACDDGDDDEEEREEEDEDNDNDDDDDGEEREDDEDNEEEEEDDNEEEDDANDEDFRPDDDFESNNDYDDGLVEEEALPIRFKKPPPPPSSSANPQNLRFSVFMRQTYVSDRYLLYVPKTHSQVYLKNNKEPGENVISLITNINKNVYQEEEDDDVERMSWTVEYRYEQDKKETNHVRFCSGWKEYVVDNNVQTGDVCLFDLISHKNVYNKKNTYRVTIIKQKQQQQLLLGDDDDDDDKMMMNKYRVLQRAKAYKSKYPHFVVSMRTSYIPPKNTMHIPRSHSKAYYYSNDRLRNINGFVTLLVCGHSDKSAAATWQVQYTVDKDRSNTKLTGPTWIHFATDNALKPGDACVFELLDINSKRYRVTIFRTNAISS